MWTLVKDEEYKSENILENRLLHLFTYVFVTVVVEYLHLYFLSLEACYVWVCGTHFAALLQLNVNILS